MPEFPEFSEQELGWGRGTSGCAEGACSFSVASRRRTESRCHLHGNLVVTKRSGGAGELGEPGALARPGQGLIQRH